MPLPAQTDVVPFIVPGCVGAEFTVIDNVRAGLLPLLLFAVTLIVPL